MTEKYLIKLASCHFALLQDVSCQDGPVDVFPLVAQLECQVCVEGHGTLGVHLVDAE